MFQFTQDCLIGIEEIDNEHRRLFEMINQAFALLQEPSATIVAVRELVAALKEYAVTHFAHEEAYMEQICDPELPRQRREHAAFVAKVNGVNLDLSDEDSAKRTMNDLLEYLSRWLYRHILGSDILIGKIGNVEKADPFAFTKEYWTGIEMIDEEHKKLFEIIRETNDLIHEELLHDKYDEIMRLLEELRDYTIVHFNDEEAYMERIGYEGLAAQRAAHQIFVDKLTEINLDDVDDNQEEYLKELIQFLLGWLSNHILLVDKKIPKEDIAAGQG